MVVLPPATIYRIGLVLCALLAVFDIIGVGSAGSDEGPSSWAAG